MFFQLYTWHAEIGNSYCSCIYFLLQKKNQPTYQKMFSILKQLLPNLNPTSILVDFEKAAINAAKSTFQHTEIKGCYFHLLQSLIRKVKKLDLFEEYTSNKESRTLIRLLPSLSFVPIEDVESLFDLVAQNYPQYYT